MKIYEPNDADKKLTEVAFETLKKNFDDDVYYLLSYSRRAVSCKNRNIYKGVNCDGIHGFRSEYINDGNCYIGG